MLKCRLLYSINAYLMVVILIHTHLAYSSRIAIQNNRRIMMQSAISCRDVCAANCLCCMNCISVCPVFVTLFISHSCFIILFCTTAKYHAIFYETLTKPASWTARVLDKVPSARYADVDIPAHNGAQLQHCRVSPGYSALGGICYHQRLPATKIRPWNGPIEA